MSSFNAKRLIALGLLTSLQFQPLGTAHALQSNDAPPQSNEPAPKNSQTKAGLQVLTDTEGVDFNSYFRALYLSVKDKWRTVLPPSVDLGQQGRNTVEFRVLQDGTVPEDSIKLVSSSDKKDLDEASMQAVRKAAPFSQLPKKYSGPFVKLRFTFYYNSTPH